jgi:ferredoxin
MMEKTIFYYTGTGNSLWVARTLAEDLGNAEVISIVAWMKERIPIQSEVVGVVFPIHMWGLPAPIIGFIKELRNLRAKYVFAVGVDAGQVANALIQLKNILLKNEIILDCGFEIKLPSNYIPWGGPGSKEKQNLQFELARQKISGIIESINKKEKGHIDKGTLWERILFTQIYKLGFPRVPKMDRSFWVDEKCNHCGICSKVCPADNITLVEGKPTWKHHCEQCLACLQWCPQEAIQSGKKTPQYERYHNPQVQLKDVLKS